MILEKMIFEKLNRGEVIDHILNDNNEELKNVYLFSNLDDMDEGGETYGLVGDTMDWNDQSINYLRQLTFYKLKIEER